MKTEESKKLSDLTKKCCELMDQMSTIGPSCDKKIEAFGILRSKAEILIKSTNLDFRLKLQGDN